MNETEVEILVLEAQLGNRQALDKLYREFNLPMKKYAVARVKDGMVAEDLVQNVWIKLTKRILRLNDVSLFRSWLYRALRWEINDWFKLQAKEDIVEQPALQGNDDTQVDKSQIDKLHPLINLLGSLPFNEREVAELYYQHDLSIREISLITCVAQGTVKSRLHRARQQLKRMLEL